MEFEPIQENNSMGNSEICEDCLNAFIETAECVISEIDIFLRDTLGEDTLNFLSDQVEEIVRIVEECLRCIESVY